MEYKKLRTRVEIDQKLLDHFNKCAAGVYVGTEDRLSFFDRLPLVSSGLAAPPVLDEGLPRKSFRIQVDESSLMADAEVLLNALNLMAIARSESRAGRSQRADLYIEQAMEVLSFGVEANVIRSRAVEIVHNFHRFPVEEPIRSADLPWNEVCPALIGPKLTTEIVEKSQCRKLTEALVKEAKSKRTHSNGKRMKTFSSKKERLENHFAIHVSEQDVPHNELQVRAGRLALFQKNWARLTRDPWVLETIQGYKLEFGDEKPRCSLHEKRSASLSDLLIAEVSKLLEKGAVEEIPWSSKVWTSSIFVIPKKDGGNRTVINLRPLNKFIKHHHFKLESIGLIRDLLERNDFMAKIDMKDAYFSVPIHSNYRKYLAFYCGGKLFQFKALPFGLSSAPYVYTRLMRVIASELRRCGIRLIVYLDDWLFIDNEKASLVAKINLIIHLFKKLGLTVNESKSQLEPSQIIEFLGVTINSKTFELSVPERKITSICNTARRIRKRRRVTLRDIARFIGQVNAVNMAASIPILFLRPLQSWLGRFHLKDANDYQKTMSNLPPACLHDLKWLSRNLDKMAHEPILHKNESLTITTDASNVGPRCTWHRRLRSKVVGDLRLRISAIQFSGKNDQKSSERKGTLNFSVPEVGKSELVASHNGARQGDHTTNLESESIEGFERFSTPMPQISQVSFDSMHHLALVAPKRVSELAALSLDSVQLGENSWVFSLDFVNKNRGFGKAHTAVVHAYNEDVLLCPLVTIKDYINRTILYRHQARTLFLSTNSPHRSVSSTTIARWLREVLKNSGIDDRFKAHSTRAASTTSSKRQGLSSKAIMEAANWAPNGTTFEKFYYKGPSQQTFQNSVLSSNRKSKRTSDGREKEAERRKKPKDHRSKKTHASKK
ncbi:reverse transcriptase [Ostertagia ostertagi]